MPYFEIEEFRVLPDMDNETKYPDAIVELARDAIESLIEDVCDTSFIERTVTETVNGSGNSSLLLDTLYVQSITSITIDGAVQSGYTYTFDAGILQRRAAGSFSPVSWPSGSNNITVVLQAGYSTECPADLKMAAMEGTRDRVLKLTSRNNKPTARAVSQTNEFGGITNFSVAAEDKPTGIPDVDATIMRWAGRTLLGFA